MSGDNNDNQKKEIISNFSTAIAKMDFIQLARIIDFIPDATLAIDLKGNVIAWNKAMENLTGIKATDILGKGDYEYALPFYNCRRPILVDLVLNRTQKLKQNIKICNGMAQASVARRRFLLLGRVALTLGGKPLLFLTLPEI